MVPGSKTGAAKQASDMEPDTAPEDAAVDRAFWKGRRVLVTGHTGFKGGWLSLWLSELGAEVTGFALDPPTKPSFFDLVELDKRVTSLHGDLREPTAISAAVAQSRPEVIFHLAAQSLVFKAHADPVGTFATNLMGSVHLMEALRVVPSIRAVVAVTSDKVYDTRERRSAYRETDPIGGFEPYSASKAACELAIATYRHNYLTRRVGLASARAGNVIGGGDWAPDRLVPDAVRAFSRGAPLMLRLPHATRPWQHVLEPVRAYLMLAERLYQEPDVWGEAWNFGPDPSDNRSVAWLADRMAALWNESGVSPASWKPAEGANSEETSHLAIDTTKAKTKLGWRPSWNLNHGLARSLDWYLAWLRGEDMLSLSCAQIKAHETQR